jgi:hypothetical protein
VGRGDPETAKSVTLVPHRLNLKEAKDMLKPNYSRLTAAVVIATVLILAAGGAAVASNMAFKLNRQLFGKRSGAGIPANEGNHWTSLPYFNPYTTNCTTPAGVSCAGAFCQATGLSKAAGIQVTLTKRQTPPLTGFDNITCPTPTATTGASFGFPLPAGQGIAIRQAPGDLAGSIIIVGSHNPALALTAQDAPTFKTWISIPYHTTAVSSRDFCVQGGLSLGPGPAATITTLNPVTAGFTNTSCTVSPGQTLTLGTFVEVTEPNGPKTFVPAHF